MKKFILSVLSVFLLSFVLVGCGSNDAQEEIETGYKGNLGDNLEYEVVGLESTTKLEGVAPVGNFLYYEPEDSSNVLLDFVLDVTNNGKQDFSPYHDLEGNFTVDGAEYAISALSEVGGEVTNFNAIKPKSTGYVHIYTEINEEAIGDNIQLQLQYGSVTQSLTLNKESLKIKKNELNYGDSISDDNVEISVTKGYTTKRLDTPVQGEYFSHYYQVEDAGSTYAILELNILNNMTSNIKVDDTVSVSTLVDEGYQYSGFLVGLSDDQTNFDAYAEIEPNKTKTIYALIEIPDSMLDKQITFRVNAFRKAYFINLN